MKALVVAILVLSIGAYVADCSSLTPMQAMQCCKTMPCSPHHQGQNCCQVMPLAHAPFVQATAPPHILLSAAALGAIPAAIIASPMAATRMIEAFGHAPPILPTSTAPTPLRI